MLSLTKLRKSRATESNADVVEPISISAPPSPPSPQKGPQKISPKVKPMIIIDEPMSPPTSPTGENSSPTLSSASIRFAALSLDTASDPSSSFSTSELGSAPSSPTASSSSPKSRDSQSQMRGFSKVSFRIKQLVSKEKRRFAEDGFNLDLTYVTNRLIAFGCPAESLEGIYRNHYKDVYNFFEKRHPDRYRIYNLCSERTYDKEKFHNRVAEFRFDDHCPPPIALFLPFCQDVDEWLQAHPENVAAIHCKAGKGRTGVMICAYLLYIGAWKTANGAMEFFGAARSLKHQGVTIPSQRRFIGYFGEMCHRTRRGTEETKDDLRDDTDADATRERELSAAEYKSLWEDSLEGRGIATKRRMFQRQPALPASKHLKLMSIALGGVYTQRKLDPRVRIECGKTNERPLVVYDFNGPFTDVHAPTARVATSETDKHDSVDTSEAQAPPSPSSFPSSGRASTSSPHTELKLGCDRCIVWDEVQLHLRNRNGAKIGHFWIHTSFVPRNTAGDDGGDDTLELVLEKHEIDKVVKDIKRGHKKYAPSFCVKMCFKYATEEEIQAAEFAQRMAALKVDAANSSSSSLLPTRFSSPGSVSLGKAKATWTVEKCSEGQLHKQFSSSSSKTSPSPAAATTVKRQRSKPDRGAQSRETAAFTKQRPSPLAADDDDAEQAPTDGSVKVFGTRRGGDGDSDEGASVQPVETARASPKAAVSPRQ